MNQARTYDELDRLYDRLYELGDWSKAQRARIAYVLWQMVQADTYEYGPADLRNYRLAGLAGMRYLQSRGLGLEPGQEEIKQLDRLEQAGMVE